MPFRKRIVDLVFGSVIAALVTPFIFLFAAVSAAVFRANPFFVHERIGRGGHRFRFVKIRSLPVETPQYLIKDDLVGLASSRWGRFIRAHHLDEFPQVWHVVAGRMSLVGPRPEMPSLDGQLHAGHRELRHAVRPGCTGLWQISSASAGLIKDAPEFDTFYVHNWTLRLDLWILTKTLKELVGGRPIESLDAVPGWVRPARPRTGLRQEPSRTGTVS